MEHSGSVGRALDWDRWIASSSLTAIGVLSKTRYPLLSTGSIKVDPA